MKNRNRQNRFVRAIKKFLLSAFVIVTFTAYALENRVTAAGRIAQFTGGAIPTPAGATTTAAGTPNSIVISTPGGTPPTAAGTPTGTAPSAASAAPTPGATATATPAAAVATPTPAATATRAASAASSGYKDGTYTGPVVDVNWGNVQVQATIQGGKISNVQFLQYPSDRRTSQRINSIADPELQQEAIQAQSANVDIITGATLTSEGFQQSLQALLDQAKS